jgi:hypothetical protein
MSRKAMEHEETAASLRSIGRRPSRKKKKGNPKVGRTRDRNVRPTHHGELYRLLPRDTTKRILGDFNPMHMHFIFEQIDEHDEDLSAF